MQAMQTDAGGFTIVSKKVGRRRAGRRDGQHEGDQPMDDLEDQPEDQPDDQPDDRLDDDRKPARQFDCSIFLVEIRAQATRFGRSAYFKNFVRTLQPTLDRLAPAEIVCYGLGNFTEDRPSKDQLKFLICLARQLLPGRRCALFDPVFNANERRLLRELGFALIERDESCCHRLAPGERKLLYVPHGHKFMYNNLLWANWRDRRLQHLLLLGNSFELMTSLLAEEREEQTYAYLHAVVRLRLVEELPVSDRYRNMTGFNDMSILTFDLERVAPEKLDRLFDANQPKYKLVA